MPHVSVNIWKWPLHIYSCDVPRLSKAATDAVKCEWTVGCHAKRSCQMNVKWLMEKLTMHMILLLHWCNRNKEYHHALIRAAGIWTNNPPPPPNYSDKHFVLHYHTWQNILCTYLWLVWTWVQNSKRVLMTEWCPLHLRKGTNTEPEMHSFIERDNIWKFRKWVIWNVGTNQLDYMAS